MSVTTKGIEAIKQTIIEHVDQNKERYLKTSHQIHAKPEIGNEEYFASRLLIELLREEGVEIEKGVGTHETAFVARRKSTKEGLAVAFLAEYDALPGIGHACGHNIIGTTSVAAAIALSKVIDEVGGEVVVFGTPAEEGGPNGSAKGSFVREGLLVGIDAAIMLHPGNETRLTGPSLGVDPLDFEFFGKPAHASANPDQGVNALDGVIQLFNGINALREHLPQDVTIHGIITDGGDAPNIVPEYAKARFFIRAETKPVLKEVSKKLRAIAEGAALITGATVEISRFQNEVDNFIRNQGFDHVFKDIIEELGETIYSEDKKAFGSTDAGNISQVVPTIHPTIKIGPNELVGHTVEFREAAKSEKGDEALIIGAKANALTMLELLLNKSTFSKIQQEFDGRSETV